MGAVDGLHVDPREGRAARVAQRAADRAQGDLELQIALRDLARREVQADLQRTQVAPVQVLAAPELRLTLVPAQGDALVLEIGPADAIGRRWVLCAAAPQLARTGAETASMLMPDAQELSDASRPNAWDAWLRAELAAR